jgi:MFS family permease
MTWIVTATPDDRRGAAIGTAIGMAIFGSLFGPVIGSLAAAVGRPIVFSSVAAFATILVLEARALPSSSVNSGQGLRDIIGVVRRLPVLAGIWLMLVPAVAVGVLDVLGPLRLSRLGAGALAIGATFLVAGVGEGSLTPVFGRLADRRGRIVPMRVGLGIATAFLLLLTLPGTAVLFALGLVATFASFGSFWAPATAMLSEAAEAAGLDRGLGFGLVNFAWAAGLILGAAGGGALAGASGNAVTLIAVAGMCGVTLLALLSRSRE